MPGATAQRILANNFPKIDGRVIKIIESHTVTGTNTNWLLMV